MAMNMKRAFNSKFLTKAIRHSISAGYYDENNVWVEGVSSPSTIRGVLRVGNKLSKMEEGEALHSEDGGARFSNFRTLHVTEKYPIELEDKIEYKGKFYNVIQKSDETTYGFFSVLLEKSEEWTP